MFLNARHIRSDQISRDIPNAPEGHGTRAPEGHGTRAPEGHGTLGVIVAKDEGKTFSEINGVEPSTFDFPVVVHPREPDTAWFVPEIKDEKRIPPDGKLIVAHARDGGKSFDVLTKGLPQSHAYDVVYRHALALDEAGDRLAFGPAAFG
jgi:hypothetical protein